MPDVPEDPPAAGEEGKVPVQSLKNSDFKDMFDVYRKQMEHEDVLVNQRITFNTVIQGALITCFIFAENLKALSGSTIGSIRVGLALVGIVLVGYAFIGILAAVKAADSLASRCDDVLTKWKVWAEKEQPTLAPFVPVHPRGGNSKRWHFWGFWFGPWAFLTFFFVWIGALFILPTGSAGITPGRWQLAPNAGQAGEVFIFDSQTGDVWRRKDVPTK